MGLINCPDCDRRISDLAPACIGCGRPMPAGQTEGQPSAALSASPGQITHAGSSTRAPQSRSARNATQSWGCPSCGSNQLLKHSDLFKEGGEASEPLGWQIAPPDRETMTQPPGNPGGCLGLIFGTGFGVFVGSTSGAAWGVAAFFGVLLMTRMLLSPREDPEPDKLYQAAMRAWRRSYLCLNCGESSRLEESGRPRSLTGSHPDVDTLLLAGRKIQAIKVIRERHGIGLKEAKERAEARLAELR